MYSFVNVLLSRRISYHVGMFRKLTPSLLSLKLFLIVKVHLRGYSITDEMAVQGYFTHAVDILLELAKLPSKQV